MKTKKLKIKGVTLIELSVVLAIVFLLVGTVIVEYNNFDDRAQRNADLVPLKALANGLEMYKLEWKGYPPGGPDISIDLLAPYVNLTSLKKAFDTTVTTPVNGLEIWTDTSKTPQPFCIYGSLKGVNEPGVSYPAVGSYVAKLCVQTNETDASTKSTDQPTCYWGGKHGWQACALGL